MLQKGYEWLCKNKLTKKNRIVLSNVVARASLNECSGAQHSAVMNHLYYIDKKGIDKWKQEVVNDE